ncbi:hypothetical protein M3J09_010294 [Ascochyta lentis]
MAYRSEASGTRLNAFMAYIALRDFSSHNFWADTVCTGGHVLRGTHFLVLRNWPALDDLLRTILDLDCATRRLPLPIWSGLDEFRLGGL